MGDAVFREIQRIPGRWRRLGVASGLLGSAGVLWAMVADGGCCRTASRLSLPIALIALLGLAWLAAFARLEVAVTTTSVEVRWFPFATRSIARERIMRAEAVTYRPLRQFGGWGIRFGAGGARAYSMSGDRAVALTLDDGTQVYLGSLEPEALAAAIDRARA